MGRGSCATLRGRPRARLVFWVCQRRCIHSHWSGFARIHAFGGVHHGLGESENRLVPGSEGSTGRWADRRSRDSAEVRRHHRAAGQHQGAGLDRELRARRAWCTRGGRRSSRRCLPSPGRSDPPRRPRPAPPSAFASTGSSRVPSRSPRCRRSRAARSSPRSRVGLSRGRATTPIEPKCLAWTMPWVSQFPKCPVMRTTPWGERWARFGVLAAFDGDERIHDRGAPGQDADQVEHDAAEVDPDAARGSIHLRLPSSRENSGADCPWRCPDAFGRGRPPARRARVRSAERACVESRRARTLKAPRAAASRANRTSRATLPPRLDPGQDQRCRSA